MNNYVQRGETLTVTAPYAVTSGGGVLVSNKFGIASFTALISAQVEILTVGVFDLAKDASTFTDGDRVFWDDTNKVATSKQGPNREIGTAQLIDSSGTNALGGLTGDATVRLRLLYSPSLANRMLVAHFLYNFATDGGASCTPAIADTIPANALVFGGVVNSTIALTAAGSATFAVGTVAGSSTSSILAATGKASLSLDAVLAATAAATPFKMTAAGQINVTIATGPLTAGQVEGWVYYTVATNA